MTAQDPSYALFTRSPPSPSGFCPHQRVRKPPPTPNMPTWVTAQEAFSYALCVCVLLWVNNNPLPNRAAVPNIADHRAQRRPRPCWVTSSCFLCSAFSHLTQWRHIPHECVSWILCMFSSLFLTQAKPIKVVCCLAFSMHNIVIFPMWDEKMPLISRKVIFLCVP